MTDELKTSGFRELGLSPPLLEALAGVGYETPSPIQAHVAEDLKRLLREQAA